MMEPMHQKCLTRKRIFLLDNLSTDELLDYLIQDDIITIDGKDEIQAKGVRRKQCEALLDKLPLCGPEAFGALLNGLEATKQKFIVDDLIVQLEELEKAAARSPQCHTNTGHHQPATTTDWLTTQMCHEMRIRRISEIELSRISAQMPPKLTHLGVEMGFHKSKVEQLEYKSPHSLPNQAMDLFCAWRNKESSNATVENFVRLLRGADISEEVYKEIILEESREKTHVFV